MRIQRYGSYIPERSLSFTKIMQTRGKKACFLFPERSLSYTKIMQGERNSKAGKRSFTGLDIAEPKLILYKDNANERKESLLSISRVQLILYKDIHFSSVFIVLFLLINIIFYSHGQDFISSRHCAFVPVRRCFLPDGTAQ